MERYLVFCAHADDEIVGMGGSLMNYVKEGKDIVTVIFSFGERSQPHLKEEHIAKARVLESKKVDYLIGKKSIFLGLDEGKILEQAEEYGVRDKIKKLIKKYRPVKVFAPSAADPHPDHHAVNSIVSSVLAELKYKGEFYTFEVWNVINETHPAVFVDVSSTFKKKLKLLKRYKSQKLSIYLLWLPIYFRGRRYGEKIGCDYAEKFYKVR
ncbi:MAG: PIG-L family deacetylase [Candidatus Nanoarchaeia archaeon]